MLRWSFMVVMAVMLSSAAAAQAPHPAVGTWDFTVQSPVGENKSTLLIKEEGGVLSAIAKSAQGERPLDKITVDGASITMVISINYEGSPMVITYTGTVDKAKMSGEADFGGLATGTWSATAQK